MSFRNEKGFSLVQTMVASGIMGAMAVAMMNLTDTNQKNLKHTETKSEILSLLSEARSILASPKSCMASFGGINASDSGSEELAIKYYNKNDEVIQRLTKDGKHSSVIVRGIQLNDTEDKVEVFPSDIGSTYLYINFERQGKLFGDKNIRHKIKLYVETDGDKLITKCRSFSSGESNIWERNDSNVDDIFYNSGRVTIGTTTPFVLANNPSELIPLTIEGSLAIVNDKNVGASISAFGSEVSDAGLITLQSGRGTRESSSATQADDRLGAILFRGHSGEEDGESGFMRRSAEVGAYAEEGFSSNSKGSALYFSTSPIGALSDDPPPERMRITSDGKIGIGTTEPLAQLDLKSSEDTLMRFIGPDSGGGNIRTGLNTQGEDVTSMRLWGDEKILAYIAGDYQFRQNKNGVGSILGETSSGSGTHIMNFNGETGNVGIGIGTEAATAPLDLFGRVAIGESKGDSEIGADIRFDRAGVITAGSSLYLNIKDGKSDSTASPIFSVGIGKDDSSAQKLMIVDQLGHLEVKSGVKVGTTNSCNNQKEGTIRYNSGIKNIEVCNGSIWISPGGSKPITRIQKVSSGNSTMTVTCPNGMRALNAGYRYTIVKSSVKRSFLRQMEPTADGRSYLFRCKSPQHEFIGFVNCVPK
jgi:hypothetical protein